MKILFTFSILFISLFAFAQAGAIDKTYGKNGFFTQKSTEPSLDFPTQKSVLQADNKLLYIEENQDELTKILSTNVIRLTAAGAVDKTFGNNGVLTMSIPNTDVVLTALTMQSDGKILLTGFGYKEDSTSSEFQILIFRLNSNGSLDGTFGTSGKIEIGQSNVTDAAFSIKSIKDGKILIGGVMSDNPNSNDAILVRLNANGTIDTTFGNQGSYRHTEISDISLKYCFNVDLDKNGNIFMVGQGINGTSSESKGFLIKINANGTLDKTFGNNGSIEIGDDNADDIVFLGNLKVQADGKIVVLKRIILADETNITRIIRYLPTGKEDPTFGNSGVVTMNLATDNQAIANDLLLQSDGKILVNAINYNVNNGAFKNSTIRYDSKGKIDNVFGIQGSATIESDSIDYYIANILMASDGKIIVSTIGQNFNSNQSYQTTFRLLNPEVTATENITVANNLSIFPNPTQSDFVLSYTLDEIQNNISIDLVNLEGKVITTLLTNLTRNTGKQIENIHLNENITSGVYFLKIKTDKGISQIKIVKI